MKRRMPPHVVLPNGMWRFVKRGTKTHSKRKPKVIHTARRHYARRAYHRSRGIAGRLGGGKMGMIIPVVGGAADKYLANTNILGVKLPFGVGSAAIGWFAKRPMTMEIGLYNIGSALPGYLAGGLGGGGGFIGQGD